MGWNFIFITWNYQTVWELFIVEKMFNVSFWDGGFSIDLNLLFDFKNVNIVKIIEIFAIESTKNDHITSNKASTMSPSCFRQLNISLERLHRFLFQINNKNIIQIITESSPKNINLILINRGSMSPSRKESIALDFPLSPS